MSIMVKRSQHRVLKIVSVILSFCISAEFYFSVGRKVSKGACFRVQH